MKEDFIENKIKEVKKKLDNLNKWYFEWTHELIMNPKQDNKYNGFLKLIDKDDTKELE